MNNEKPRLESGAFAGDRRGPVYSSAASTIIPDAATKPATLAVQPELIPPELKTLPRFVDWRWEWREGSDDKLGKWTKPPRNARTGGYADSTRTETWATFDEALAVYQRGEADGIGFVLTSNDDVTGIDLDHCVDRNTGEIAPWALEIVEAIRSYTEISPSGTGVRILVRGALPEGGRKRGAIECYSTARYVTLTGHRVAGTPAPIEHRQAALNAFHARHFPARQTVTASSAVGAPLSDHELLNLAFRARNSAKVRSLYQGDDSMHGGDTSAADLALVSALAFWTRDPAQLDRLMRGSARMRAKWGERHAADGKTYGELTIDKALQSATEAYRGERHSGHAAHAKESFEPDDSGPKSGDEPTRDESPKGANEEKESRAEAARLMKLLYTGRAEGLRPELFRSPDGEPYAFVPVAEHFETWAVASLGFRDWLQREYYRKTGRPLGEQGLKVALGLFSAIARFEGATRTVHVRVAHDDGNIYVDLGDPQWRVIEIGPNTWDIASTSSVRFRRSRGMLPLPVPELGGNVEELRQFLNVSDATWPLALSWLIMALRGRGPFPVIVLVGEQGSGKTTAARVLRSLLDPSASPDRTEPREERDLAIAARNSYAIVIDNLSRLPRWLSDAFSRLATGAGLSTRQLYSDSDEVFFFATRPVALNGISEFVQRSDLLDRALLIELEHIPENERRSEADFWSAFEAARPRIFGALLSVVASALAREGAVHLAAAPRMADFARWLTAAEASLGWPAGSFLTAYRANRSTAHALALDGSLIVPPLRDLSSTPWEGTMAALLAALTAKVELSITKQQGWPRSPRALGAALRTLVPNLRADGIEVSFRREAHTRSRLVRVRKFPSPSSPSSAEPRGRASQDGDGRPPFATPASPSSPFASPTNAAQASVGGDGDDGDASRATIPDGELIEPTGEWETV